MDWPRSPYNPRHWPPPDSPDKPSVTVYDTTLRDGEQMAGVAFSAAQKLELARALAEAGIEWIEAGFPVVSREEAAAVEAVVAGLAESHPHCKVLVLARCLAGDVEAAAASGAYGMLLFSPASEIHLRVKGLEGKGLAASVAEAVETALAAGLWTSYSTEDSFRTPAAQLRALYDAAVEAGAQRLGLTDTVGAATPEGMACLVGLVRHWFPNLPLSVHCHNDYGLAAANALAGVAAGAQWVATTVAGLGERGGNVPLEEFVMAFEQLYGGQTNIATGKLKALSHMACQMAGIKLQPHKPVVGANAFTHESGLHAAAVAREPASYEPYPPAMVGQARRFLLGKHTGKTALADWLRREGLPVPEGPRLESLLASIKSAVHRGEPLTAETVATWLESPAEGTAEASEGGEGP